MLWLTLGVGCGLEVGRPDTEEMSRMTDCHRTSMLRCSVAKKLAIRSVMIFLDADLVEAPVWFSAT